MARALVARDAKDPEIERPDLHAEVGSGSVHLRLFIVATALTPECHSGIITQGG